MPAATIYLPLRPASYDAALEGLTSLNEEILGQGQLPPLYASGARYQTEPNEMWRHAAMVAGQGWGDCEDLAAYRAGECRVTGEDPDAYVHTYVSGPRRLHAIVMHGDGTIEDPSLALGMQPAHPDARVVDDPLAGVDDVTWDRDVSGGFRLRVPMRPAPGADKALMIRARFPRPPHFGRRGVLGGADEMADVAGIWGGVLRVTRAVLSTPEARMLLPAPAQIALARYGRAASIAKKIASAARGPRSAAPPPPPPEQQPIVPDEYMPPPPDEAEPQAEPEPQEGEQ